MLVGHAGLLAGLDERGDPHRVGGVPLLGVDPQHWAPAQAWPGHWIVPLGVVGVGGVPGIGREHHRAREGASARGVGSADGLVHAHRHILQEGTARAGAGGGAHLLVVVGDHQGDGGVRVAAGGGHGDQGLHLRVDGGEVVQARGGQELLARTEQGRLLRIHGHHVEADDLVHPDAPALVLTGPLSQDLQHVRRADPQDRLHFRCGSSFSPSALTPRSRWTASWGTTVGTRPRSRSRGGVSTSTVVPSRRANCPASRSSRPSHEFSSGPP